MCLEQPDYDVAPGVLLGVSLEQHPERLPDAGGHAEEHAELAATRVPSPAGGGLDARPKFIVHAPRML